MHKLHPHETNMPLEIILNVAAKKQMKKQFEMDAFLHVSSIRTLNYQIYNNDVFE